MKKIGLVLSFIIITLIVNAQQIGLPNHYFYKPMIYNPAFAGVGENTEAMIISKDQWANFKNSPSLNVFTLDGNLNDKRMGLGLKLLSDKKGLSNTMGGDISYSYRLTFTEDIHLSFGLALGVLDHRINFSKAILENGFDPSLVTDDAHKTAFDGNAGIMFKWKEFVLGASIPHLLENKTKYFETYSLARYTQARHYMGVINYKFNILADKGLTVTPQVFVNYLPNTPFEFDANVNLEWKDKLWLGGTYKNDYAVAVNAGICITKQLYVGYSYDFMIGKIANYAGVSQEIMLSFKFRKNKPEVIKEEVNAAPAVIQENKVLENKEYELKIDSLQKQLKENDAKIKMLADKIDLQNKVQPADNNKNTQVLTGNENKVLENKDYESKIEILQNRIKENEEKIKILMDRLNAKPPIQRTENNKNAEAIDGNENKVMEKGIWLITNKTKDFTDDKNHEPQKGFYIIVGTFIYQDFAIEETQRFNAKGFKANWVYYNKKKFNYVYTDRIVGKEEALKKAEEYRQSGIKNVWIQILVE
ncbi:MAG: PorP/SprF family type IX secretion system membrane protein [Bacteroidia bacterium]